MIFLWFIDRAWAACGSLILVIRSFHSALRGGINKSIIENYNDYWFPHGLWSQLAKVQWFGKSNPLAEVPVQLFYYVQRAWEFQVVYLLYQLLQMLHMRNSIGGPIFSDFKSDLSRVAGSRPLVKGNEDAGYEGGTLYSFHLWTKFVFSLQATKMKSHTRTRISFKLKTGITHCGMTSILSRSRKQM